VSRRVRCKEGSKCWKFEPIINKRNIKYEIRNQTVIWRTVLLSLNVKFIWLLLQDCRVHPLYKSKLTHEITSTTFREVFVPRGAVHSRRSS